MSEPNRPEPPPAPPPRAFTQGVGLLFQWVGVVLFLASFFVCCGSSLVSREHAIGTELSRVGWHFGAEIPRYSGQQAVTISLVAAVFFGMALAGVGLGLQAQNRRAAPLGVAATALATLLWFVHLVFFISIFRFLLAVLCLILLALFGACFLFAYAARREMLANPPPDELADLPPDYKLPYSHLHDDPPEVRLARELAQRRERLAVQQKELEMLEEKLQRKLQQRDE